jgi:hypothetical protein
MTIETESSDGVVHEFPDGTDRAVIDRVMKSYAMAHTAKAQPQPVPVAAPGNMFAKDPNYEYNTLVPLAVDKLHRGQGMFGSDVSMALPDVLRSPLAGADSIGAQITGDKPITTNASGRPEIGPDELAALSLGADSVVGAASAALPTARAVAPIVERTPAQIAKDAGYVLPSSIDTESQNLLGQLGSSFGGGKTKMAQAASEANQTTTNKLARQSLGLPDNAPLTDKTFASLRAPAYKAYDDVANSIPQVYVDQPFKEFTASLTGGRSAAAAKRFSNTMDNPGIEQLGEDLKRFDGANPQEAIDFVRTLRSESRANMKAFDDPKKLALGQAQKDAANQVDDLIERNLGFFNKPELVQSYRDARELISKSHAVEDATDAAGNVSARDLARQANKGRPLTAQLKTIADAADSFPKAFQNPSASAGQTGLSKLDLTGAAIGVGATLFGHPGYGAAALAPTALHLAQPVSQKIALSRLAQLGAGRTFPGATNALRNLATGAGERSNALQKWMAQNPNAARSGMAPTMGPLNSDQNQ